METEKKPRKPYTRKPKPEVVKTEKVETIQESDKDFYIKGILWFTAFYNEFGSIKKILPTNEETAAEWDSMSEEDKRKNLEDLKVHLTLLKY